MNLLFLFLIISNFSWANPVEFKPSGGGFKAVIVSKNKSDIKKISKQCKELKIDCSLFPSLTKKNTFNLQVVAKDPALSQIKKYILKLFPSKPQK